MSLRICLSLSVVALAATAYAGIDRGGITRGLIESIEPLVVAGTEFDSTTAVVAVDGIPVSTYDLMPGQIATVTSTFNGVPVALSISSDVTLRGAVEQSTEHGFTLLGQTVRLDTSTIIGIAPAPQQAPNALAPGLRVDVNAFALPDGSWLATRVDLAQPGHDRVSGTALAPDGAELVLGDLVIDYSIAKLFGFKRLPRAGDHVTAQGKLVAPNRLRAIALTRHAALAGDVATEADIEGYVTRFGSAEDFDVDGIRIRSMPTTDYPSGGALSLDVGVFVSVDGVFSSNGDIVAERLEIKTVDDIH